MARLLGENKNSKMGKTLSYISDEMSLSFQQIKTIQPKEVKRQIRYASLDIAEHWKIHAIDEVIQVRDS